MRAYYVFFLALLAGALLLTLGIQIVREQGGLSEEDVAVSQFRSFLNAIVRRLK